MDSNFWWGKKVDNLLFKGLSVDSTGGIMGICVLIGGLSFFFECLRYMQVKYKQKELLLRVKQIKLLCPTESAALLARTIKNRRNPLNITLFDRAQMFGMELSLWLLIQNVGYFLMLSVMVYNAWFLVSAVIGGGIGYFIFGHLFLKMNLKNCRIMRSAFCTQICGDPAVVNAKSMAKAREYDLV